MVSSTRKETYPELLERFDELKEAMLGHASD